MDNKINELEQPLNANERFLYAIAVRMDALVNMMSSFMEVYAKQHNLATTSNIVDEQSEVTTKSRRKK